MDVQGRVPVAPEHQHPTHPTPHTGPAGHPHGGRAHPTPPKPPVPKQHHPKPHQPTPAKGPRHGPARGGGGKKTAPRYEVTMDGTAVLQIGMNEWWH